MKNKDKYDLRKIKFIVIYDGYSNQYEAYVTLRSNETKILDKFVSMDSELNAIMNWLEEESE